MKSLMALPVGLLTAAGLLACGRAETPPASAESPRVEIVAPADGDSVSLPLTVRLRAKGVEVVPATGAAEAGKGHHHLAIGIDAPADDSPLPGAPTVVHLGTGTNEYVIDSLAPGSHRIIAIFAAGDHVPMPTVLRDTVTVIVR
jgi:hypothetical protein